MKERKGAKRRGRKITKGGTRERTEETGLERREIENDKKENTRKKGK